MNDLKRPLQALLIADDSGTRESILNGSIQITIRAGLRDYQPGFVLLCCPANSWCVGADITENGVRYCNLGDVTSEELKDDGYKSHEHILEDFKRFGKKYQNMDLTSKVTVIRWDNVRGNLVDEYRKGLAGNE